MRLDTANDPNAHYYRLLESMADAYAASVRPPTRGRPPQGMEWVDIDKILPQHAPDTPNWVEKLKRSIEQKGYDFLEVERRGGEHITVTKVPEGAYEGFYVLTAGHHRVQAIKELEYRQVPVVFGPPELWQGHLYTAIQFKVYGPRWFNRSPDERDFGEDSLKALDLAD